jgi:hypothetical protein
MSRPDQPTGYRGDRDERVEPAGAEARGTPPERPPGEGARDREWEGYDVAILNAVLDS